MFYEKNVPKISKRTKKLTVSDFSGGMNTELDDSVLPLKYAKLCYNFDNSSGAIKDGIGVTSFKKIIDGENLEVESPLDTKPLKCYYYKKYNFDSDKQQDSLIIYCEDKKLYSLDLTDESREFSEIEGLTFDNAPSAINYRFNSEDVIIFTSENEPMKIFSGSTYPLEVTDAPKITSMCFHYERLFATTYSTSLWFSDDFDPSNWYISLDEAGFIDMPDERGKLLKVISFLGYLYVFRNYGISRITAYGDQTQFTVSQLFVSSGKIIDKSISVCGDRVIFLAEDGLYQFDGIYTKKILENYSKVFDNILPESVKSEFLNGILYLAFTSNINGKNENLMLVYNILAKTSYFATIKVDDIVKITNENFSKVMVISDGKIAQLIQKASVFQRNLKKIWRSPKTDFGSVGQKNISKLSMRLNGKITFTIKSEKTKKSFSIKGKGDIVSQKINLRGSIFEFKIESDFLNTMVSKPVIEFEVL